MTEAGASDFRERAQVEADRYGPDPWIFVRELLQNSRDAGAHKVVIEVREVGGMTQIHCRDDGEGMDYEHARRYLFSLYASSKEERANQVGRFGVGFWSILRFDPERIVIRSRPRTKPGRKGAEDDGKGWQVVLDGALQNARRSRVGMEPGTQILLERPAGDGSDHRRVYEAAHQNARFLCLRDDPEAVLPITVNGRLVNAEFAMPAPSSAFRRGHVRGVVGLGSAPRVELFSRGLRVRSAACLDDLLSNTGHTSHSRVRFPELPGGLAPQALLESDGLELLLSRSDARDTRTLRRLVRLGQNELRHLVERQLAQIRPPGLGERLGAWLRRLAGESTWWRAALGAVTGAVLALLIAQLLWPQPLPGRGPGPTRPEVADARTALGDIGQRYGEPRVAEINREAREPLGLQYAPGDLRPYFAALVVDRVGRSGAPTTGDPYPGKACTEDCVNVVLPVAVKAGEELRVPIPTGHRLDVASLRYDGVNRRAFPKDRVLRSRAGEAVLAIEAPASGILRYTTGPAEAASLPPRTPELLPAELARAAEELRELPLDERLPAAIDLVRERVRYTTSQAIGEAHDQAMAEGKDFVTRTLEIGAGDCDVQNGLLVAVLHAADVDARLAVGWVGERGTVRSVLHAWVEYLDEDQRWRVADATVARGSGGSLPPPAEGVAVAGSVDPDGGDNDESGQAEAGQVSAELPAIEVSGDTPTGPASGGDGAAPDADEPSFDGQLPAAVRDVLDQAWVPWAAVGSGLFGLFLLGLSLSRRTARNYQLDEGGDLSGLLQGALAQPAAFRHLPALFHRRLIPLRGGSALSLQRARTLAADGRLYAGGEQTELGTAARRRGVTLLDTTTPEGRTVAASLGAIDLDRWGQRLDRSQELPVLLALAAYLREQDERWRLRAIEGLGDKVATLDLRPLLGSFSARRRLGDRLVLVDMNDPWLVEAERCRAHSPHAAAFALLDHILDHLDLGAERRARLLAPLAAKALAERAANAAGPPREADDG